MPAARHELRLIARLLPARAPLGVTLAQLAFACLVIASPLHAATRTRHAAREVPTAAAASMVPAAPADTGQTYAAFLAEVAALAPDSMRVAPVASLQIERDAGVFVLEQGNIALCRPVAGRVRAAVFTGSGTFAYSPGNALERDGLLAFEGRVPLRRPFTSLVLLFSDSTLAELETLARFGRGETPAAARDAIREALLFVIPSELNDIPPWIAKPLLAPAGGGLFYAHLQTATGPLFFAIDPLAAESVKLLRRPDDDHFGMVVYHHHEVLSQERPRGDTLQAPGDLRPVMRVTHHALDVHIGPDLLCDIASTLDLESNAGDQRWLAVSFGGAVGVDSVRWTDGSRPALWANRQSGVLWVRCDPPLGAGERRSLRIRYHARLIERDGDLFYNDAPDGWYPAIDSETPSTFDLEFHYPDQYQLAATGERLSGAVRGGERHEKWRVAPATRWVSFDIGLFRVIDVSADSLPPIHVFVATGHGAGRSESLVTTGRASRSFEQSVAAEVRDEARFFRRAFGALPERPLYAVHTTDEVLRAYPQLIHLPLTFRRHIDPDVTPYFYRAHEVAHQWWGLSVRPGTYHDAWLSEGFADFAAAWYVQNSALGTRGYLEILGAWRRRILDHRKYTFGRTTPSAPVAMGDRTNSSRTVGDYDVIIYNKGAWVLHMLRNLMLSDDDPDERRFSGLMRDFCAAHAGATATTAGFRAAAERAAGRDLGWFFAQWIERAEIPTYTFSYRVSQDAAGRWVVRARVAQSRVPDTFRMEVPVRVEYGKDRFERLRVSVTGPLTEFELPPVESKPTRVVFNDLESVLCELVPAPWK